MPGEFFRAKRPCAGLGGDAAHLGLAAMGVLHYTKPSCGVSDPRVVQFPPIGGGDTAVCGGVAAKVQTHWVKNADNGLLVAKWSAFGRIGTREVCCAHERGLLKFRLHIGASRCRARAGATAQMPTLDRGRQPWPRARLVRRTWPGKRKRQ